MLSAEKISKTFGPQTVLKDISLILGDQERIGIVGINGAGKSTFVKILAGIEEADKGVVNRHGSTVGYLNQESQCRLGVTIADEMRDAFPNVEDIEARLMKASHAVADGDMSRADAAALDAAANDLVRADAHTIDARIGRVLAGLGFELDAVDRLTDTFSGGWQMRIAMAKLLLQEPDFLFLDEPTNHLDIDSRRALLERERAVEAEKLWAELAEGQVRKGIVRSLQSFGAFVDIGGADALLPISQISWKRINDISEILSPGQQVEVKILTVDPETRKISVGLKQLLSSPWQTLAERFRPGTIVTGKVTRTVERGGDPGKCRDISFH